MLLPAFAAPCPTATRGVDGQQGISARQRQGRNKGTRTERFPVGTGRERDVAVRGGNGHAGSSVNDGVTNLVSSVLFSVDVVVDVGTDWLRPSPPPHA